MEPIKFLEQLGLDEKESRVYFAALELGESLIMPLAKKAGIKRPSLYEIIPRLHELGLLKYGSRGKRRTVIAEDPSQFVYLQEQKLGEMKMMLPQMMSYFNKGIDRPKISSFEGVLGIKQVYEDTLREGFPILSFLQVTDINPEIRDYLLKSYVPRRVRKGIRVKNVVSGNETNAEEILPVERAFRENRYVDQKLFPANIEVLIYSNKVAFATYKAGSAALGIIIESGEIAETMRSMHKMAWELAGK